MKRGIFLCALSFLSFAAISRGFVMPPVPGQGIFLKADNAAEKSDIWVYGGAWCYWDGGGIGFGDDIELAQLGKRFMEQSCYADSAQFVSEEEPFTGTVERVFVLDSTPLYFDSDGFYADGIYGFGDIKLAAGKLYTNSIDAVAGVFVDKNCEVNAGGQISAGGVFECSGGTVRAGDIYARKIWLDSFSAPLSLTVSDSVMTGLYTQCGGSAIIGGGLFAVSEGGGDGRAAITVNGEFAEYNAAQLRVGEDIVSAGDGGEIEFGGGSGTGGLDETARTAFIALRSGEKLKNSTIYEITSKKPAFYESVTVTAGGTIRASGDIKIYGGDITAGGTIESKNGEVIDFK